MSFGCCCCCCCFDPFPEPLPYHHRRLLVGCHRKHCHCHFHWQLQFFEQCHSIKFQVHCLTWNHCHPGHMRRICTPILSFLWSTTNATAVLNAHKQGDPLTNQWSSVVPVVAQRLNSIPPYFFCKVFLKICSKIFVANNSPLLFVLLLPVCFVETKFRLYRWPWVLPHHHRVRQ